MTQYTKPTVKPAWAETGDKTEPTTGEIQTGWPLSSVPPSRQRFNWILNFCANAIRYFMQMGIPEWDAAEDYPVGAKVLRSGNTYTALLGSGNINKDPAAEPTYWELWGFTVGGMQSKVDAYLSKNVAGAIDVTLTAAEAANGVINLTGALTGSINVIVPDTARRWVFKNSTSGAFNLTVKTLGGSGYTIPQGSSAVLYCDAVNVYRVSAAGSASEVPFTPTGNIAATDVQAMGAELDSEKAGLSLNNTFTGTNAFSSKTSSGGAIGSLNHTAYADGNGQNIQMNGRTGDDLVQFFFRNFGGANNLASIGSASSGNLNFGVGSVTAPTVPTTAMTLNAAGDLHLNKASAGGQRQMVVTNTDPAAVSAAAFVATVDSGSLTMNKYCTASGSNSFISNSGAGALYIRTLNAGGMGLQTNNLDRMQIDSNGNFTRCNPGTSNLYPDFCNRAWVNFNGTGTVAILASGNVSSITDNGTGDYTANFTNALPDGNYAVGGMVVGNATGIQYGINLHGSAVGSAPTTKSTTACRVNVGQTSGGTNTDCANVSLIFAR